MAGSTVNQALMEFMRSVRPFVGFTGSQMVDTIEALVNLTNSEGGSLVQEKFNTLFLGRGTVNMAVASSAHGNPYTLFLILLLLVLSSSFDRKCTPGQISEANIIPADAGSAEEDNGE